MSKCPYCEGSGCRCLGYGAYWFDPEGKPPPEDRKGLKPNQQCWCEPSNVCQQCGGSGEETHVPDA